MSSSPSQATPENSQGRQKMKLEKMRNQSNLRVTFSRRRTSFFEKANELSLLCGAEVGTIVFSPHTSVYSFGHPSVDSLFGRFLNGNPSTPTGTMDQMISEANRKHTIDTLNQEVMRLEAVLAQEIKEEEDLDLIKKRGLEEKWYPPSFDEFNLEELNLLEETLLKYEKTFNDEFKKATRHDLPHLST